MTIPFWKHGSAFFSILYQLGKMEEYVDFIHFTILDETSAYRNFIGKAWSEDEKAELYHDEDEGYDKGWITKRNEEFKNLFYAGFLISWHSYIESQLRELCGRLDVNFSDKGGLIGKYRIEPTHWNEFKTIAKLRNKIVHDSRGRLKYKVSNNAKTFKGYRKTGLKEFDVGEKVWIGFEKNFDPTTCKYSEKHQLLRFVEDGLYIVPSYTYSKYLINFGKQFFMKIHDDLYKMEKSSRINP